MIGVSNVKEADKDIIKMIKGAGRLVNQSTLQHSYPFCWRSDTPLIYKVCNLQESFLCTID